MYGKLCCAAAITLVVGCLMWSAQGIDINAADLPEGPADPAVAAQKVIGPGVTLLAGSANYLIQEESGATRPHLPAQVGLFSDGLGPAATLPLAQRLLPFLNRNVDGDLEDDPEEQTEEFAFTEGGIGLESGIVLSTGRASADDGGIRPPGVEFGVPYGDGGEGPNNGRSSSFTQGTSLPGEISNVMEYTPNSGDFVRLDGEMRTMLQDVGLDAGANSAVLEFKVNVAQHGRLTFEVVFATDEFPNWIDDSPTQYDDAFVILVAHDDPGRRWQNLGLHNSSDPLGNPNGPIPFRLANLVNMGFCRPMFKLNLTAPAPPDLLNSPHGDFDGDDNRDINEPYYDHEYAFFTKVLRREIYLVPGNYIVKFVVADGEGDGVDSALFIKENGVYLNTAPFVPGDFNNNGQVEQGDLDLVLINWGDPAHPIPSGWKNMQNLPIGIIDQEEQDQVLLNWGTQTTARVDFNRDGVVNAADQAILDEFKGQLLRCGSVNEGDANDDGKVDSADQAIFNNP